MPEIYQNNSRIMDVLNTRESRTEFCSCELISNRITARRLLDKEDLINLFFATWIDQVIYWMLVDSRNPFCLKELRLYKTFYKKFKFLKFYYHGYGRWVRPISYLTSLGYRNLIREKNLLLRTKQKYWDQDVKEFFLSIHRGDIIELAEQEFLRDLSLRHRFSEDQERKLKYLWVTNLIN